VVRASDSQCQSRTSPGPNVEAFKEPINRFQGLSYRPARLHRLAESILGLFESLQIRALGSIRRSSDIVESERATDEAGLKKVLKNVTNVKYIRVQYYRYLHVYVQLGAKFHFCTVLYMYEC